jgi:two-component system response regulator HydG
MSLVLAVTRGPDVGARLVVGTIAKQVGRSRSCDLALTDPGISRVHLEAIMQGNDVVLRCVPGTAPMLVDGEPRMESRLAVGGTIVLADTVLSVIPPAIARTAETTAQPTALRGLLQGLAGDVKSLRSITTLLEALDECDTPEALAAAVDVWSRSEGAGHAQILAGDALDATLAEVVSSRGVLAEPGRIAVAAPPAVVCFAAHPTEELVRMLGVAGRLVGSAFARVERARSLEADIESLRTLAVGSSHAFLGTSAAAAEVSRLIPRLAASPATALVLGESGTGKSFFARLVHEASPRAKEPFRVLNCAAIPESLVESELFGHERGAFSGAVSTHLGAFEAVGKGTLFLDEIGELSLAAQAKLLRVLEERRFERVGSNRSLTMEARVLAATNRDLAAMVQKGQFRQDLFFRVSVVSVRVPPLRDRADDIVLLANQILADVVTTAGRRVTGFSPRAIAALRAYSWPGNVRELRNAIEHALVLGDTATIEPGDLPETIRIGTAPTTIEGDTVRLPANLVWLEEQAIQAALRATNGNRTKAAALLGINRVTLYKKLKEEPGD